MSVFSERLTSARKAMGWTRKRAVAEFQLPYQTYSNYEQGKREPDINTMKQLANKLNTTTDYLKQIILTYLQSQIQILKPCWTMHTLTMESLWMIMIER